MAPEAVTERTRRFSAARVKTVVALSAEAVARHVSASEGRWA
ncbi:MAG: hypothetical protein ABFC80_00225 [Coriobacteriales bacterium]